MDLIGRDLGAGSNQVVHSKYWPMDLVSDTDAPIACLYGHQSIPHSSGYGNRKCEYTGERLQWAYRSTGMDVILPNPEGIRRRLRLTFKSPRKPRFYIVDTSNSLVVLPQKPALLARASTFDWTQFYSMLPHAEIGLSKAKGMA